jgi:hypothetical protein
MNLVMMEVLPTDSSPRKTSLYLERGMTVEEGVEEREEEEDLAGGTVEGAVDGADDMRMADKEKGEKQGKQGNFNQERRVKT